VRSVLRDTGNFDYVMVKHRPLSSEITDFVVIEFQTGQTTGTGKLVNGLSDFMQGRDVTRGEYEFGVNYADIWKRTFTQVLNKGIVLENWGQKIYWVVQEPVYQDLVQRYKLTDLGYSTRHSTVFLVYDLRRVGSVYELVHTRMESATIAQLFDALRNNKAIPSKEQFVQRLTERIKANMELKLRLAPE